MKVCERKEGKVVPSSCPAWDRVCEGLASQGKSLRGGWEGSLNGSVLHGQIPAYWKTAVETWICVLLLTHTGPTGSEEAMAERTSSRRLQGKDIQPPPCTRHDPKTTKTVEASGYPFLLLYRPLWYFPEPERSVTFQPSPAVPAIHSLNEMEHLYHAHPGSGSMIKEREKRR